MVALLHAEQAWDVAMNLILDPKNANAPNQYDIVTLHTGRCFDLAQNLDGALDMGGKSIPNKVQARSSAALVLAMLHAAQEYDHLPSAAHAMLGPAADFLLSREVPSGDDNGGVWTFLGKLAKVMNDQERRTKIRLDSSLCEEFRLRRNDRMFGLRRELDFLDVALVSLTGKGG